MTRSTPPPDALRRPRALLAALLCAAALLPARPARAGDDDDKPRPRRAGNVVYVLPAGWESSDGRNRAGEPHHNLRPSDHPDRPDAEGGGAAFYPDLYLLPGAPLTGGADALKAWAADRITTGADVGEGETVKVLPDKWVDANNPAGPRVIFGLAATTRPGDDGVTRVLPFVALKVAGRAELAYADVSRRDAGLAGDGSPDRQPDAVEALAALVDSMTFLNLGAAPLEPPPAPGHLDGVYRGSELFWTVGMNAQMVATVTHPTKTFFADGTFADGLPPGGLNGFDYAAASMAHTADVGTYRRSADPEGRPTVVLSYASGETQTLTAGDETLPDAVIDGATVLTPVGVAPDGWTFDGRRSTGFTMTSGFAGSGTFSAVSGGSSVTFRADGTAESDRWSSFTSTTTTGDATVGAAGADEAPTTKATYRIEGGLLTLTAPDGSTTTYTAFIADEWDTDFDTQVKTFILGGEPTPVAGPLPEPVMHTPKYDPSRAAPSAKPNPLADPPAPPANPLGALSE